MCKKFLTLPLDYPLLKLRIRSGGCYFIMARIDGDLDLLVATDRFLFNELDLGRIIRSEGPI